MKKINSKVNQKGTGYSWSQPAKTGLVSKIQVPSQLGKATAEWGQEYAHSWHEQNDKKVLFEFVLYRSDSLIITNNLEIFLQINRKRKHLRAGELKAQVVCHQVISPIGHVSKQTKANNSWLKIFQWTFAMNL